MAEIGFVGRVLCAGIAFTAVAIESACHSTFATRKSLKSSESASAADYDTQVPSSELIALFMLYLHELNVLKCGMQNVVLSAIKVEHNETLLEVHLGYQAKMAAQNIQHRAEMQQVLCCRYAAVCTASVCSNCLCYYIICCTAT